jgi:hypothetical protein
MNTYDDSSDRRYFEAEKHAALAIKDEKNWLKWETEMQFRAIRAHLIHALEFISLWSRFKSGRR